MDDEQLASVLQLLALTGAQEPIPADFCEATREHVLEESRKEGVRRERHRSRLVSARMGIVESDTTAAEPVESLIGEGDAIHVAREIERRVLTTADLVHVH